MLSSEPVRKVWMRLWSPMRCMMSPVIFESKNEMGSRMSLARKSEMREMLTRVVMCSISQLRISSLAVWPRTSTTCAMSITTMKLRSPVPIPVSITDWVRNGRMRLMMLPVSMASRSWTISCL